MLRDGSKLYGFLGRSSYFSSDPDARDLFISHVIQRDKDGKMTFVAKTGGVYISKDQVSLIEFLQT